MFYISAKFLNPLPRIYSLIASFTNRYISYKHLYWSRFLVFLIENQECIYEEIKCRFKAGNSFYYTVQTVFYSRFLSKNLKIKIIKTIIFLVVLYGCETLSLRLNKGCKTRVFENLTMRRIFWPKRNENREWRRLHNEELLSSYRSASIVRVIKFRRLRWVAHVARMDEGQRSFKILTDKPTWKRPLGGPRCRWEDNIRMDLNEIATNTRNWVDSAQDRDYYRAFVNAVLNLRVP